jgi:hypothetical protein
MNLHQRVWLLLLLENSRRGVEFLFLLGTRSIAVSVLVAISGTNVARWLT